MVTYAEVSDVQGIISAFDIGRATSPDRLAADSVVIDIDAELNSVLDAAGLSIPVTTPSYFVDWLKALNKYGAAAAILKSMFPDAVGVGETPAYAFWEARYRNALKLFAKGQGIPDSAAKGGSDLSPSTYLTRNPDVEEDLGDIAEPRAKMGRVF
jgi:hypothetical protein